MTIIVGDVADLLALEFIPLEEIPADESLFYGRHAQWKHPNQVTVWDLYDAEVPYWGKHRDDDWYDRTAGEPMVMWSEFSQSFMRHNITMMPVQIVSS